MTEMDSTSDTQDAEAVKNEARRIKFSSAQLELILRSYVAVGALIAAGSLIYFGLSFLDINLTTNQRTSLIMAGAGASVSVMSSLLIYFRRQQTAVRSRYYSVLDAGFEVVRDWSNFERTARRILLRQGQAFNAHSPRSIISTLEAANYIDTKLAHALIIALDVRNRLVHQVEPVPLPLVAEARSILAVANDRIGTLLHSNEQYQTFRSDKSDIGAVGTVVGGGVLVGGQGSTFVKPQKSRRE